MSDVLRAARGVSHCHHCFNQLMRMPGGTLSYKEVVTPDGQRVRVHHQCWPFIMGDGYKPTPEDAGLWERMQRGWASTQTWGSCG